MIAPGVGDRVYVSEGAYRGWIGCVRGTMPRTTELVWMQLDGGPVRSVPARHLRPEARRPRHVKLQEFSMHTNRFVRRATTVDAVQWDGTAQHASEIIDWILDCGHTATYYCSMSGALRHCDRSHSIRIRGREHEVFAHPFWYVFRTPDTGVFLTMSEPDFVAAHQELADLPPSTSVFGPTYRPRHSAE